MTVNDCVAALGMCRFSFFVFFVLTYFRYSCYRIDEAVGAEKRLLPRAIEKLGLAVARPLGGVVDWRNVRPQERGRHILTGRITAQHWAGRVKAQAMQKP